MPNIQPKMPRMADRPRIKNWQTSVEDLILLLISPVMAVSAMMITSGALTNFACTAESPSTSAPTMLRDSPKEGERRMLASRSIS